MNGQTEDIIYEDTKKNLFFYFSSKYTFIKVTIFLDMFTDVQLKFNSSDLLGLICKAHTLLASFKVKMLNFVQFCPFGSYGSGFVEKIKTLPGLVTVFLFNPLQMFFQKQ